VCKGEVKGGVEGGVKGGVEGGVKGGVEGGVESSQQHARDFERRLIGFVEHEHPAMLNCPHERRVLPHQLPPREGGCLGEG
jgi:hypothetical protein